jgi:periplasmic protein TonB
MTSWSDDDVADLRRWLFSSAAVVLAYASVTVAHLAWHESHNVEAAEPSGAIVVELAPMAASPNDIATDIAPGPEQAMSEAQPTPKPEEKQPDETPDLPQAENLDAAAEPPIKTETKVTPQQQASAPTTTVPPAISEQKAVVPTAPTQGRPDAKNAAAVITWQTQILALIERNKRYPDAARSRREQGTAHVAFTLDRKGLVVNAHLRQSSGVTTLDDEALALLKRAQPFPVPPTTIPGDVVVVRLPIRFTVK